MSSGVWTRGQRIQKPKKETDLGCTIPRSAAMFDTKTMKWIMKPVSPGKPTVVNGSVQVLVPFRVRGSGFRFLSFGSRIRV